MVYHHYLVYPYFVEDLCLVSKSPLPLALILDYFSRHHKLCLSDQTQKNTSVVSHMLLDTGHIFPDISEVRDSMHLTGLLHHCHS